MMKTLLTSKQPKVICQEFFLNMKKKLKNTIYGAPSQ